MAYVDIVTALALLQYLTFGFKVGRARGRYAVKAPAVTGNELFERHFRVHQNTLEQLVVFLPGLYLFSHYLEPRVAAVFGLIYLVGRELFAFNKSLGYSSPRRLVRRNSEPCLSVKSFKAGVASRA